MDTPTLHDSPAENELGGDSAPPAVAPASAAPATVLPDTDIANARRLVERHGDKLRYCHLFRFWYVYDGKSWQRDDRGQVMLCAKDVALSIADEASKVRHDDVRHAKLLRHAANSANAKRLWAMVNLAQSELSILPTELGPVDVSGRYCTTASG
jgi:hypothetical protein